MDKMLEDLKHHESSKEHVLKTRFIEPLVVLYKDLSKFQELVEETLDLEMADKGEYIVKASFDDKLAGSFFNQVSEYSI
jgi:DNA mismatch repair protein MSH2